MKLKNLLTKSAKAIAKAARRKKEEKAKESTKLDVEADEVLANLLETPSKQLIEKVKDEKVTMETMEVVIDSGEDEDSSTSDDDSETLNELCKEPLLIKKNEDKEIETIIATTMSITGKSEKQVLSAIHMASGDVQVAINYLEGKPCKSIWSTSEDLLLVNGKEIVSKNEYEIKERKKYFNS